MDQQSGRNVQQPDYLNDKDQAEDREGKEPGKDESESNKDNQRDNEAAAASLTEKAFRH